MNISVKKIMDIKNIFLFIAIAICFLFISIDSLNRGFQKILEDNIETGYTRFLYLALVFIFASTLFKKIHRKTKSIDVVLFLFSLYFLLRYSTDISISIRNLFFSLFTVLWVISFKLGQGFAYWDSHKLNRALSYFGVLVIIPLTIQTFILYIQSDILSFKQGGNDAVFAIIAYLPFAFALKEKKLFKIILISLFLIIALLSLKRSIILASFLSTLFYVILTLDKKKIIKYIFNFYTIIIIGVVIYVYKFLEELVIESVIGRFENIKEDRGSGREDIYNTLLDTFWNSNTIQVWLGHGYKATLRFEGVLAHNDFLNILFDFGIIGFSLYIILILLLIKKVINRYRYSTYYKNEYATFIATLINFFILSTVNNMIYSPNLLMPITFIIGLTYTQLQLNNITPSK